MALLQEMEAGVGKKLVTQLTSEPASRNKS